MVERARTQEATAALASRPTFIVTGPEERNLYIEVVDNDFQVADSAGGPWIDVEVSEMLVKLLPSDTDRLSPELLFKFQTKEKHDLSKV